MIGDVLFDAVCGIDDYINEFGPDRDRLERILELRWDLVAMMRELGGSLNADINNQEI